MGLFHLLILFERHTGYISPDFAADGLIEIKIDGDSPLRGSSSRSTVNFDEYQNEDQDLSYGHLRAEERPMRFYFDIHDRLAIRDEVGRDFKLASEAIVYAKQLAADLRCLEPDIRPQLSIQVMCEGSTQIHQEAVFA
jgi:hypothetical protein